MICDLADVAMRQVYEEEKIPTNVTPTPSAAHNPKCKTTSDGHEFQATKSDMMSKTSKTKETFGMQKMSKMAENVTNSCNSVDLTKLAGSPTSSMEKVAAAEITHKCDEMR